jgi:hypothetical protein
VYHKILLTNKQVWQGLFLGIKGTVYNTSRKKFSLPLEKVMVIQTSPVSHDSLKLGQEGINSHSCQKFDVLTLSGQQNWEVGALEKSKKQFSDPSAFPF